MMVGVKFWTVVISLVLDCMGVCSNCPDSKPHGCNAKEIRGVPTSNIGPGGLGP